jgi:O-antigen/teichoic acid export membrane protein
VLQAATAAANRIALFYQTDRGALLRLGGRLVGVALAIGGIVLVIALTCGRWLLTVLYTADYAAHVASFQIIVAANVLALLTNVFGVTVTQMRLFWLQVPAQTITLVATTIAAVLLIPGPDPVRGAALTVLVRAIVQFILYAGCVAAGLARRPATA